ncbi:MAG TPA: hypothetical protein DCZ10_01420 [Pelotomaculum sp.]|nr:hypothetical protein [Pelotomaculum sp.]
MLALKENSRKLIAGGIALCLLLAALAVFYNRGERHLLSYQYFPGSSFNSNVDMEITQNIYRYGEGSTSTGHLRYTVSSRVLAVEDDGVATIEEKWVRQDDGQAPQEFNLNEIYPLIGETIVFRADPSGKVLEVTGISGDGQINEVEVAQWKASRYRLPGKLVAVGAGWSNREEMPLKDGAKTTIRTESRLKNIFTEGAEKVAEIQIHQEIPIDQETNQQGMTVRTTGKLIMEAGMLFNLTRGEEKSFDGEIDFKTANEVTHADGKVVLVNGDMLIKVRERGAGS